MNLTKLITQTITPIDLPRDYIGASIIGSDCLRQIWYEYRAIQGEPHEHRHWRKMQIGKNLESIILQWLCDANVNVKTNNSKFVDSELNYFCGNVDAVLPELDAVIDIKIIKSSSFREFISKGLRRWSRIYYAQLQAYMGMGGYSFAYLLAMNKDTAELHDERIEFDPMFYKLLKHRAEMIHASKVEPPKAYSNPSWWLCKMCKFRRICHEEA